MPQRVGHSQSLLETDAKAPHPEREVSEIVQHEKDSHDSQRSCVEPERAECHERAQWKPARPHETIANAAERSTQCRPKTVDHGGRNSVQLRARERADGDACEIRVSIEVSRVTRQRFRICFPTATARQEPQRRLHCKRNSISDERLVIPGTLNREQAQIHPEPCSGRNPPLPRRGRHPVTMSVMPPTRPARKRR